MVTREEYLSELELIGKQIKSGLVSEEQLEQLIIGLELTYMELHADDKDVMEN